MDESVRETQRKDRRERVQRRTEGRTVKSTRTGLLDEREGRTESGRTSSWLGFSFRVEITHSVVPDWVTTNVSGSRQVG